MIAVSSYLVNLDTSKIRINEGTYEVGGVKLYLPIGQEIDFSIVPQTGEIIDVPDSNYWKLQKGDIVIFHYFVNEQVVRDDIRYILEYNPENPSSKKIYGYIRNGQYYMLNNKLIVDKIVKNVASSIHGFELPPDYSFNEYQAVVKVANSEYQIPVGTTIGVFKENLIPLETGEKGVYMVDILSSVPFYLEGEEMVVLKDWAMIEPVIKNIGYEPTSRGLYMPSKIHEEKHHGVIKMLPKEYNGSLKVGDLVYFQRKEYYKIPIQGKEYYFSNLTRFSHILGKLVD